MVGDVVMGVSVPGGVPAAVDNPGVVGLWLGSVDTVVSLADSDDMAGVCVFSFVTTSVVSCLEEAVVEALVVAAATVGVIGPIAVVDRCVCVVSPCVVVVSSVDRFVVGSGLGVGLVGIVLVGFVGMADMRVVSLIGVLPVTAGPFPLQLPCV